MTTNTTAQRIAHLKNTLAALDKMQAGSGELQLVLDVSTCATMENSARIEISGFHTPTAPVFEMLRDAVRASLAANQKSAAEQIKELEKALQ
jgi:hypothetical protein